MKSIVDSAPDKHRSLFQSAMLTGARVGELLGLQWKHINFKELKLEIRQALWDGQLVAPKTACSVRTIYFGPALELALAVQLQNAIHTKPDDFVFCKLDGSPLNPDLLRRDVLYPMLDRLGISRTSRSSGFHTFRHSAASIVNHETGNLKLAQKFLGHSNLSTTTYAVLAAVRSRFTVFCSTSVPQSVPNLVVFCTDIERSKNFKEDRLQPLDPLPCPPALTSRFDS